MNITSRIRKLCQRVTWFFVAAAIVIVHGAFAWNAGAATVAIVTDVQGKVSISANSEKRDLVILAEIARDARIELAQGARLVTVYLNSGEEYAFNGPAAAHFRDSAPQSISGAQPTRKPSALRNGEGIRIRPLGVTQAAVVMRSARTGLRLRLLSLARTHTLDTLPEFRWQPIVGVNNYRLELADPTGATLMALDVQGDSYRLPAAVKLKEGVRYTWEVSTRLPDGRKYAGSGDFSIMPADQRQEVERLRPTPTASLAERVAFAAWLEQQDLRDEARKYWKDASAERSADARLKQLAGE